MVGSHRAEEDLGDVFATRFLSQALAKVKISPFVKAFGDFHVDGNV